MTKAERLAAKIQRDKDTMEKAAASEPAAEVKPHWTTQTSAATRSARWPMRPDCWRQERRYHGRGTGRSAGLFATGIEVCAAPGTAGGD